MASTGRRVLVLAVAVAGMPMLASGADAPRPGQHSVALQVVKCMKQRMAADRYLSYNQAARDCRAFVLKAQGGNGPLVAEDRDGR